MTSLAFPQGKISGLMTYGLRNMNMRGAIQLNCMGVHGISAA